MQTMIHAERTHARLSRRERQWLAHTQARLRRAAAPPSVAPAVALSQAELDVIGRLVRHDRTPVSAAMLVVAPTGAGEARRRAVLDRVRRDGLRGTRERRDQ